MHQPWRSAAYLLSLQRRRHFGVTALGLSVWQREQTARHVGGRWLTAVAKAMYDVGLSVPS
jgi:hypothetical protein